MPKDSLKSSKKNQQQTTTTKKKKQQIVNQINQKQPIHRHTQKLAITIDFLHMS